ncbi:MAG: hypothetical protein ACK49P_06835 [Bacteroidota bacterium]
MKTLNFNIFKKGAVICALFCASPSIAQTAEPIMGAEIKAGKLNIAADDLGRTSPSFREKTSPTSPYKPPQNCSATSKAWI